MPKVLKNLKKTNVNKKIKLRYKNLKSGNYSLYLDLYQDGDRKYRTLKIYLQGTRSSRTEDKEKLKVATTIRNKKERELFQAQTGFKLNNTKLNENFLDYYKKKKMMNGNNPANTVKAVLKHLKNFTNGTVKIKEIDKDFCESFKNFLNQKISENSVAIYFTIFKSVLKMLVDDDIISKNPARNIKLKKSDTKREFLTVDELKLLKETGCKNKELKNAFLFSCFTGLRISDIKELTFDKIKEGYLTYRQRKTGSPERVKIKENALEIIEKQREKHDNKVFDLPSHSTVSNIIKNWVDKAGIKKYITFHCARHTFAALCLTSDIDFYTLSKLLGHKDIKTTQIYAKLIDKKKDEAVDKLPKIFSIGDK